jgi:hypothetical protein
MKGGGREEYQSRQGRARAIAVKPAARSWLPLERVAGETPRTLTLSAGRPCAASAGCRPSWLLALIT